MRIFKQLLSGLKANTSPEQLKALVAAAENPSEKKKLAAAIGEEISEARRYGRARGLREGEKLRKVSFSQAERAAGQHDPDSLYGGSLLAGGLGPTAMLLVPAVQDWMASETARGAAEWGSYTTISLAGMILGFAASYAIQVLRKKRRLETLKPSEMTASERESLGMRDTSPGSWRGKVPGPSHYRR